MDETGDDLIRAAADHGLFDGTDSIAPARPDPPAPECVAGRYELLAELGRGGFGAVWRARDRTLGRDVALKLLKINEPDEVARFELEARVAARLRHANVVSVHDVGVHEGRPYLVMDLIDGRPMSALVATLGADQLGRILAQAARGLGAAHAAGVLHRDVKPGNILVDAEGTPYVADFGLAKPLAGDTGVKTVTGSIMGTPMYMAPEQAAGDLQRISPRSDVFSLGVVLYEILTRRNPFLADSVPKILDRVQRYDPPPPSRRGKRVPVELDWVCLKALEKDPARRYADANEFAADIERFYRGENVVARPASLMYRAAKRVRRNPWAWGMGAAAAALVAVAAIAGGKWRDTEKERNRARLEAAIRRAERDAALVELELATREQPIQPLQERFRPLVGELGDLLRMLPDSDGYASLGKIERRLGHSANAERALREAIELNPANAEARFELGLILTARARAARSERIFTDLQPDWKGAMPGEAALLREAAEHMSQAGIDSEVGRALIAFAQGNPEAALRQCEEADRAGSLSVEGMRLLGLLHLIEDRWEDSAGAFLNAQSRYRCDWESLRGAAEALIERGVEASRASSPDHDAFGRSIELLDRAVRIKPDEASVVLSRARARWRLAQAVDRAGGEACPLLELAEQDATSAIESVDGVEAAYNLRGNIVGCAGAIRRREGREALPWFRRAFDDYSEALRHLPEDAGLYSGRCAAAQNVAGALLDRGEDPAEWMETANKDGARAVELDPTLAAAHANRAAALEVKGNWKAARGQEATEDWNQAIEFAARAHELAPWDASPLNCRGNAFLDKARDAVQRGIDPRPDFQSARDAFSACLAIRSDDVTALCNRGIAAVVLSKYLESSGIDPSETLLGALEDFKQALAVRRDDPSALMNRGNAFVALADAAAAHGEDPEPLYRDGIADLDRVTKLDSGDPMAFNNRGTALLQWANFLAGSGREAEPALEEALECFDRALALKPDYAVAYENRGNGLLDRGKSALSRGKDPLADYRAAVENLSRSIELGGERATALNTRGTAYLEIAAVAAPAEAEEAVARALEDLRRAVELKSDDAQAHSNLANAEMDRANLVWSNGEDGTAMEESAILHYTRAIELDPQFASAYNNRGIAWMIIGERRAARGGASIEPYRRALADFDSAIEKRPGYAFALGNRANALFQIALLRHRDGEEAIPEFEGAIEAYGDAAAANPRYANAFANMGIALERFGEIRGGTSTAEGRRLMQEALRAFERALAIRPSSAVAQRADTLRRRIEDEEY